MPTTYATNPDGTPFYANIWAQSSVRITINEGYALAQYHRDMVKMHEDMLPRVTDDVLRDVSMKIIRESRQRATDIEAMLDQDKRAQYMLGEHRTNDADWLDSINASLDSLGE